MITVAKDEILRNISRATRHFNNFSFKHKVSKHEHMIYVMRYKDTLLNKGNVVAKRFNKTKSKVLSFLNGSSIVLPGP